MNQQNLLYLYDLPKDCATSTNIHETIKQLTGLMCEPQIRRDPFRPFYAAIVKLKARDKAEFDQAKEKLRYFDLGGKPCRSLPIDKEFMSANITKMNANHSIFAKISDKSVGSKEMHEALVSKYGKIMSAKVSINDDHTFRGYGFATFEKAESATKAAQDHYIKVEINGKSVEFIFIPYKPKDKSEIKKAKTNIYVKNFPKEWNEAKLKEVFGKYGNIKSCIRQEVKLKDDIEPMPFAFICYDDPTNLDNKEYGTAAAKRAIEDLNDKEIAKGVRLYVREAIKKQEGLKEKQREQMRYKLSKKKCNLYVKNIPTTCNEDQLKQIFQEFGEIESLKVNKNTNGEAIFALVCFKKPEDTLKAQTGLNGFTLENKQLQIHQYEPKEQRQIKQQQMRDQDDFLNYQKQFSTNQPTLDLLNKPEIYGLIQQLVMIMQRNQRQQRPQGHFQGGQMRGPRQFNNQSMPQQPRGQGQPPQFSQQPPQPMGMRPQASPMMQVRLPGQQVHVQAPVQAVPPHILAAQQSGAPPQILAYLQKGFFLLPAVVPQNPNLKNQIGEFVYEYVETMVGEERAPKITGMLIDLPLEEIKGYLLDYSKLVQKTQETVEKLQNQY